LGALSGGAPHPQAEAQNQVWEINPEFRRESSAFQPQQLELFRSPPEEIPSSVRQVLHESLHGISLRLAQRLPMRHPAKLWAVPGRHEVCLISQQVTAAVGVVCDSPPRIMSHGLFTAFISDSMTPLERKERVIIGIVPDEVQSVVAFNRDSSVRIQVRGNVFKHRDQEEDPPDEIRLVPDSRNMR
jgi:hypothetical protein